MKKALLVLGLLATGMGWVNGMSITPSSCGSGCYTFTVDGVLGPPAGYSYFWFFDDGACKITSANTVNHVFRSYPGSGPSRTVRVEVTRLYEKGDKPTTRTIVVTPSTFVTEPETVAGPLSIVPNRTPVAGDTITYVVTYGQSCDGKIPSRIELEYDPAVLSCVQSGEKGFHQETFDFSDPEKIIINLNAASFDNNKARRIFIRLRVDPSVAEHQTVGISGNIFMVNGQSSQPCLGNPATAYQTAQLSHDPNYIVANTPMVCGPVSSGETVQYTIHFQNIGQAPANTVEVRTWLPKFFSETAVYQIHPYGSPTLVPVNNGEIVWTLSGPQLNEGKPLRGAGEPGYGSTFFEEDTKDHIVYEVAFDPTFFQQYQMTFDPCQAVVNRAEIVFDCNPSIHTNFYQTVIGCPTSVVGNCFCDTLSGAVIFSETLPFSGTLPLLDVSGEPHDEVVWYPPVFLQIGPFSPTQTANPPRSIDYMASLRTGECQYKLAHYRVERNCDLSISAKVVYKQCDGGVLADIEATAITSGSAANLVWNWECGTLKQVKNGTKFTLLDQGPNVYHLTVKDTQTGCWAETVVVVSGSCSSFPWKPVVIGAVLVLLGLVIFLILRKK